MKKISCKRGFTLIELLVVVLIIGILAAVAVPQYKKAVRKSKAAQVDVIISAASKVIDAYLLENGFPQSDDIVRLTGENSPVTIDMPGDCSKDDIVCYTDVGSVSSACNSSKCSILMHFSYNADGTYNPHNTWLSSKETYLILRRTAPGGKWMLSNTSGINKNSTDAEEKQAGEVICPIVEKYVAEDDAKFVANCK